MTKQISLSEYKELMDEIDKFLTTIFGSSRVADEWWYNDNFEFGLKTPMLAFYDNPENVYKYVSDAYHKKCQK